MSTYREDRRSFARFIDDPDDFHALWHDFDKLRQAHAKGALDAVTIGLGLRALAGGAPQPAIVLQVERLATARVPIRSASGFPLFVEEVGKVVAGPSPTIQDKGSPFTSHHDKPPGGVSIAPLSTNYAGTLGCFVTCAKKTYILSNRHVLDPALNGLTGGPGVQQQAFLDGNVSNKIVATTAVLATLQGDDKADSNVDAALAVMSGAYDPRILTGLGGENNFAPLLAPNTVVNPGDSVTKSGRTTGKTTQEVDLISAQTRTAYGNGMTYLFKDCISIKNTSPVAFAGGDSGSLLTNTSYQPVGLLFAGSSSTGVAYASKIAAVLTALENVTGAPVEIIVGTGADTVEPLGILPQPLELVD